MWIQIRLCHKMRQFLIKSVLLKSNIHFSGNLADLVFRWSQICQVWFLYHPWFKFYEKSLPHMDHLYLDPLILQDHSLSHYLGSGCDTWWLWRIFCQRNRQTRVKVNFISLGIWETFNCVELTSKEQVLVITDACGLWITGNSFDSARGKPGNAFYVNTILMSGVNLHSGSFYRPVWGKCQFSLIRRMNPNQLA